MFFNFIYIQWLIPSVLLAESFSSPNEAQLGGRNVNKTIEYSSS